jgi:uncharacterized protein
MSQHGFSVKEVCMSLDLEKLIALHELDLEIRQISNNLETIATESDQIEKRPSDYVFSYDNLLEDLNKKTEENNRRLEILNNRREIIASVLEEKVVSHYERIKARNGTALADAESGDCKGCHITIRYQVLKKVRKAEQVTICENCGRILYCKTKCVPQLANV